MPLKKPLKNPFVSFTHAIRHCYLFLKAKSHDQFVVNPNFDRETPEPVTVFCVHGTADRSEGMNLLAQRLKNEIPSNIKGFHLVTFHDRFKGLAMENFKLQLRTAIENSGAKKIVLIGHSRGGLQISDLGEDLQEQGTATVDAIVPIAAPYRGSWLARGLFARLSQSVKEMSPDSEYLKNLNERMENSSIKYRFFGAKCDRVVTGASYLPAHVAAESKDATLYDRHGHLSLLSSWRLKDDLKKFFHELYPSKNESHSLASVSEAPLPRF